MKFGWPVILKALDKREKDINDALNAAAEMEERMKQLKSDNKDLLKQAKLERDEILRNARATGEQLIEDARAKATQEADRIVENARENINYEKLKAMHDLKNQIANLSIEIAEKLLQAELSDKQKANDFIKQEIDKAHLN